jgi:hypothetical protein
LNQFIGKLPTGSKVLGITSRALAPSAIAQYVNSTIHSIVPIQEKKGVLNLAKFLAFAGIKNLARYAEWTLALREVKAGWKVVWALGETVQPQLNVSSIPSSFQTEAASFWSPRDCVPRFKVAIIIPYKDRAEHLHVFVHNLVNFLKKQQLAFSIYAVEPLGK